MIQHDRKYMCVCHMKQAVPSLNNVDTISEGQSNNFNSLVFDDKLIEVLDSCCHLVLIVTRSIHTPLHTHSYPFMSSLKVCVPDQMLKQA